MPLWPYGWNVRGLASTAAFGLVKARRRSLVISGGSGLPCHFWSSGLGSKRSIWLGPPSMNMKMTFLALGAKCGFRGRQRVGIASGGAAFVVQQLRQRDGADAAGAFAKEACAGSEFCGTVRDPCLIPCDEFVQVEQHAAQLHPGRGFGLRHAFDPVGEKRGHSLRVAGSGWCRRSTCPCARPRARWAAGRASPDRRS